MDDYPPSTPDGFHKMIDSVDANKTANSVPNRFNTKNNANATKRGVKMHTNSKSLNIYFFHI